MSNIEFDTIRQHARPALSFAETLNVCLARLGIRRNRGSGAPLAKIKSQHLAVFDLTFDAIFLLCQQGKVRWANAAASRVFGAPRSALEGLSAATLVHVADAHDADATMSQQALKEFDPSAFTEPTHVRALSMDFNSFPAQACSLEVEFNGNRQFLLCVRES